MKFYSMGNGSTLGIRKHGKASLCYTQKCDRSVVNRLFILSIFSKGK